MSDPYTEQAAAIAALSAENGLLRARIEQLEAECHQWKHHAEQRLLALREVEAELRAALAGKMTDSIT